MPTTQKNARRPAIRGARTFPPIGAGLHVRPQRGIIKASAVSSGPKTAIRYAYYVFVFSLPFEGAIGGLLIFGLVLAGLTLSQPSLFIKAPPKAFWCFVIYVSLVAILGLFMILDTPQDTEFTEALFRQLFRLTQFLVFFWIAYNLMMFESIGERTWLIFAASCVLLALLQAAGVVTTEVGHDRMSTFGDNPNVVASVLGIGLLSLVGLAYGQQGMSTKMRLFVWLTAGFLLIAIVRTGSRGNLLAFILALIALTVRPSTIIARMKTILIALVVIISVTAASYQIDAVRERWENTYYEGDVAGRQRLVPAAWEMFLERPIIGWGPMNHSYEMGIRTRKAIGDPHNVYLWLLIETGLLGACPFLVGLWLCWRSVWRARKSTHGSLPLALLFFLLAINLKGTYLYYKIFWVVLAYALASGTYAVTSSRARLHAFPATVKAYGGRPQLHNSIRPA